MHDNSSASTVQISTLSLLYLRIGSKGQRHKWATMSSNCSLKCTRDGVWDLRGNLDLIFLFPVYSFLLFLFFFLLCLSLLSITPNSTLFSLLYCQVMSRPWHPPPLQTAKPKHLHLVPLRHIQQLPPLSRKGRFGESDPNLTHCSAAALTHSSRLVEWRSHTKGRISPSTVFSK